MKQSRGEEAEARRLRDEEAWEAVGPLCWEQGDPRGGVREPAPREGKEELSRGFVGSGGTRGSSSEPCVWATGEEFPNQGVFTCLLVGVLSCREEQKPSLFDLNSPLHSETVLKR